MNRYKEFLEEVAPMVVVVGSFARNRETEVSDIDFYVRRRPQSVIDEEQDNGIDAEETYLKDIIKLADKYGFIWSSCFITHIAIEKQHGVPRMLEFSSSYRIPSSNPVFTRNIYGTSFLACEDSKDVSYEETWDYVDFYNNIVKNPLPIFGD